MPDPFDIDKLKNPYTAGVHLSQDDYQLIEMGLTGVAHAAKENNNPKAHADCMRLMERLQQCIIAGQGIPEELAERFAAQFQAGMVEQNSKKVIVTFRKWLATLIRLEPDPAKAISEKITELAFMTAQQGNAQAGTETLKLVKKKLEASVERYPDKLPDTILTYLLTWVEHGMSNIEKGHDPWAGDEDVA